MSNFEEQSRFPETGRMVMPGDSVIGGPNAPINLTFRTLFDRTRWLKNTLAEYKTAADSTGTQKADKTVQLTAGVGLTGGGTLAGGRTFALGTPSKITATSTNVAVSNTHSHEIDKASPTVAGIVRTNNTLTGTSDSEALSAAMGKKLADENNRHEQLGGQIASALDAGREDLAKAGIAEQLDIEARLPVLEQSLADCSSQERELDAFVAALLAKKREMQAAYRAEADAVATSST